MGLYIIIHTTEKREVGFLHFSYYQWNSLAAKWRYIKMTTAPVSGMQSVSHIPFVIYVSRCKIKFSQRGPVNYVSSINTDIEF